MSDPKKPEARSLFPRSCSYDPVWIRKNSLGENVLYNLESLCQAMELKPGMRVLDLGCGNAISAIFLAREFGLQVWAVDKLVSATDNYRRVLEQGLDNQVFPLQLDARELPFPREFFDAVIVVDAYHYFGTDEKYAPYLARFLKPGALVGIVDICFAREITNLDQLPVYLRPYYADSWYFVHSVDWWRRHWQKAGLFEVLTAEILPQNQFIREHYVAEPSDVEDPFAVALAADTEQVIAFFRLVARRSEKDSQPSVFEG